MPEAKSEQLPSRRKIQWAANLPFVAKSLVLTRDALLVAGGASLTENAETHGSGTFWVVFAGRWIEKSSPAHFPHRQS